MAKSAKVRPSAGEREARYLLGAAEAKVARLEANVVTLARALMLAEQELANRDGYIERVWDVETSAVADVQHDGDADHSASLDQLRQLMAYSPEREASAIIGAVSPELMDRVLGRGEQDLG